MVLVMDYCKTKPLRSVGQQKIAPSVEEIGRTPLLPSEKNNAAPAPNVQKSRIREATSRYKSGSMPIASSPSGQRFPSPSAPRTTPVQGGQGPKRSLSAERKRPSSPSSRSSVPSSPSSRPTRPSTPPSSPSRPSTPVRDSRVASQSTSHRSGGKITEGLWPGMRSLSTSFQSESISIPTSKKDKPVKNSYLTTDQTSRSSGNVLSERKRTPLRGRNNSNQFDNPKPMDKTYSKVADQHRWPGIASAKSLSSVSMTKSLDFTSMGAFSRGVSPRGVSPRGASPRGASSRGGASPRRTTTSDNLCRVNGNSTSEGTRRSFFEGIGREELETCCNLIASSNPPERPSSLILPARTISLPSIGVPRPLSPNKSSSPSASSSRSIASPSRSRPGSPFSSSSSTSGCAGMSTSVLSYITDARKGKKNLNHIEDAHQLRILYNRYLQWRFVNATAENVNSMQNRIMEDDLYGTYISISELHDSISSQKIYMQEFMSQWKLNTVLEEQMEYLQDWASLEREHSTSLAGAIEALKASTIRLPVSVGTKADIQSLKNSINSAVNVMHTMGSSICSLMPNVEGTSSLVSELAKLAAEERAMLIECRELLASIAGMQTEQSSLRVQLLQLNREMLKDRLAGHG